MGVTPFFHYCKQITNVTPGKYLNQIRLEAAADLLMKEPDRSVTDVAFSCGFRPTNISPIPFENTFGSALRSTDTRKTIFDGGTITNRKINREIYDSEKEFAKIRQPV